MKRNSSPWCTWRGVGVAGRREACGCRRPGVGRWEPGRGMLCLGESYSGRRENLGFSARSTGPANEGSEVLVGQGHPAGVLQGALHGGAEAGGGTYARELGGLEQGVEESGHLGATAGSGTAATRDARGGTGSCGPGGSSPGVELDGHRRWGEHQRRLLGRPAGLHRHLHHPSEGDEAAIEAVGALGHSERHLGLCVEPAVGGESGSHLRPKARVQIEAPADPAARVYGEVGAARRLTLAGSGQGGCAAPPGGLRTTRPAPSRLAAAAPTLNRGGGPPLLCASNQAFGVWPEG